MRPTAVLRAVDERPIRPHPGPPSTSSLSPVGHIRPTGRIDRPRSRLSGRGPNVPVPAGSRKCRGRSLGVGSVAVGAVFGARAVSRKLSVLWAASNRFQFQARPLPGVEARAVEKSDGALPNPGIGAL